MKSIQDELSEKLKKLYDIKKVSKHLEQVYVNISNENKRLEKLAAIVDKEHKDVEKLEKTSLSSLFYKVLGSKKEQLEKERQEYLQASLNYNECLKSIELMEYERDLLEKKINSSGDVEAEIEKLVKEKEELLLKSNSEIGKKLVHYTHLIQKNNAWVKEADEAYDVGKQVLLLFDQMIAHLRKAREWGQWDMAGRGNMSTYMKHTSIDNARQISVQCKQHLRRFEDELRDIYIDSDLDQMLNIGNFSRFTDVFFDNLISDWIIQRKILNSMNSVIATRDKVQRIMHSLAADSNRLEDENIQIEEERKQTIMNVNE